MAKLKQALRSVDWHNARFLGFMAMPGGFVLINIVVVFLDETRRHKSVYVATLQVVKTSFQKKRGTCAEPKYLVLR
jgi:hypothetical protein